MNIHKEWRDQSKAAIPQLARTAVLADRRTEIGIKAGRQVQAAVRLVISATDLECSGTSSAGGTGAISAHLSLNRMASCKRTRNCSSL